MSAPQAPAQPAVAVESPRIREFVELLVRSWRRQLAEAASREGEE